MAEQEASPLHAGGLYEATFDGKIEQAVCLSTAIVQGKKCGLFRRFNMTFDYIEEGSDELVAWKLISSPTLKAKAPKKTTRTRKAAK